MKTNKNNINISVRLPQSLRDSFQRLYPDCMSLYIRRSLEKAVKDKNVFDKIFFINDNVYTSEDSL